MRYLRPFQIALVIAATVLISMCANSVAAQQAPLMNTGTATAGPNSTDADYRYLSLVAPRTSGVYDFSYNLCNLRQSSMAFYWEEVGFGMDVSHPLPAGLCATYERSDSGFKLEPKTTLRFSGGSQSPPAYLPCEAETDCNVKRAPLQSIITSLTSFVTKHLEEAPQPRGPTSVVSPLRVVVRVSDQGGPKEVQVDWAGSGVRFVVFFPGSKLGPGELKRLIVPKTGGRFEFETFPAFESHSELLLTGSSTSAFTISPGDSVSYGTLIFQISQNFPPTRNVIFLVVDQSGRPVARIDAALPQTLR